MNQEEYLQQRVDDQIAWYNSKSQKCQRSFKALRFFEIAAAALIPLLSGYVSEWQGLGYAVGFLGFCVAVVAGTLGLFQYQELWVEYRTICETLKREKFLFLTGVEPYNTGEPFSLFRHECREPDVQGTARLAAEVTGGKEREERRMTLHADEIVRTLVTWPRSVIMIDKETQVGGGGNDPDRAMDAICTKAPGVGG